MIVKKVSNPNTTSSKAIRIMQLTNYIVNPEVDHPEEKCIHSGGRAFLSESLNVQQEEMIALARESVRSKDPISHYILSWQNGEFPSVDQVEQSVDIFLDELGLSGHQAIYGLHNDTDNIHLHIAVNRVNPESFKAVIPNRGFDIEAAHKAIAKIENIQGWAKEAHSRYTIDDKGEAQRTAFITDKKPSSDRLDKEYATGEKSVERIAIEDAAPVIKAAKTWQQLHAGLAEKGITFERTGSGAVLHIGDTTVKASSADRAASLSQLQKRLGVYEPSTQETPREYRRHTPSPREQDFGQPHDLSDNNLRKLSECRLAYHGEETDRAGVLSLDARAYRRGTYDVRREPQSALKMDPRPLNPAAPGWNAYAEEKKAYQAEKEAAKVDLQQRQDEERKALIAAYRQKRQEIYAQDFAGHGKARNALLSVAAAEQAGDMAELRERQQSERTAFRKDFPVFPTLAAWQAATLPEKERPRRRGTYDELARIQGDSDDERPTRRDIRSFAGHIVGNHVHYVRRQDDPDVDEPGQPPKEDPAFVDKGRAIDIHDWRDPGATLAALQLSAQKWGAFEVVGNAEYKALCVTLAAEHGFKVTNTDLQEAIQQERERLEQSQTLGSPQSREPSQDR